MPLVYYVSELEKNVPLDAERLLRLLGVSGKLSGFYFAVYMLEQVQEKPEYVLLITKRLYKQTAQQFHTTSGCVDETYAPLCKPAGGSRITACLIGSQDIRCRSRRQIRSSLICWPPTFAIALKLPPPVSAAAVCFPFRTAAAVSSL